MSARSIGSLFIDIQARTARLETDMEKVKGVVANTGKDVRRMGDSWDLMSETSRARIARFAAALFGAQTMVRILADEFRNVALNIEKIKGIDPMVTASVQRLRDNIYGARGPLQQGIATLLAAVSDMTTAIGVGMAGTSLSRLGPDGKFMPEGEYKEQITDLDTLAEAQDAAFGDRVRAKIAEVTLARQAAARAMKSEGEQIKELWELQQRFETIAGSRNFNSLQRAEFSMQGLRAELEANEKLRVLKTRLQTAEDDVAKSTERGARATLSQKERVEALTDRVWNLRVQLGELGALQRKHVEEKGKEDPAYLERQIELTRQLADAQRQLTTAQQKYGETFRELADTIAGSLERSILQGYKLKEVLRSLAQDILAVLMRRLVTNPLADMIFDGLGKIPGSAAGGPIEGGRARLVGEFGPELIFPSGSSTVVPNDQLRAYSGGGDGGGLTIVYNISPGVTRGELQPLLEAHGRRVKMEVADGFRRGGGYRSQWG